MKLLQLQEESKEERKIDENIFNLELRKTSERCKERTSPEIIAEEIVMLNSVEQAGGEAVPWNLQRLSMFSKIVCTVTWILRFMNNYRRVHVNKTQELNAKEITKAELFLCRLAQKELFLENNDSRSLNVFEENGQIRTKTIISNRQDIFSFMSQCSIQFIY